MVALWVTGHLIKGPVEGDDEANLLKREALIDQAVRNELKEVIKSEYKAKVDGTRSKKEEAMAAEFDRHVNFLEGIWKDGLLSQIS
ncbi:hypothetical protein AB0I10_22675 [Streptomyces sp. NPDC050636]|uniref:hypothetical protein n=1 Tax=Streptomyces sp. NPDC050636 TaxID=3154510 RepID=UPI0034414214